jgi:hypothetical protein
MISIALSLTAKIGATRNYKQLLAAAENARTLMLEKKTWADIRYRRAKSVAGMM